VWNVLANYGGMLSIGQRRRVQAWPTSFLAFRLSGSYFAIGT
jgi:hypothetical protein